MAERALHFGVLGATSMVYRAVVADAIQATAGTAVVHEASSSAASPCVTGARLSRSYEAVLADPEVDVVYLPLPNHLHEEWVVLAAQAGKHVLCEKPLAMDARAAARMAAACADAGVVLLEAYMSPFHPRSVALQQAVARGDIGRVVNGEARMSGVLPTDNHRWHVANGGGALLDVGIYCLEPILDAIEWDGSPAASVAASSVIRGDVDETTAALLTFADGRTASLWVSFAAPDQQRLQLTGTAGAIEVDVRHATPDRRDSGYRRRALDGTVEVVPTGTGNCYEGMIAHVRDVISGAREPLRGPSRSVAVARLLDQIAVAAAHPRTC
ncbi:Gfo/Idh/MocA family protein [Euzebya tangerina]|uniref:Gfo/Idh/MocA family protein n=1 Tax=Euzebya tangerina TaxID=591198 RepID=UPI000E310FA2|nr:Gfo/Idh/MocA family oxidoreductase [Euzebya tangerina]